MRKPLKQSFETSSGEETELLGRKLAKTLLNKKIFLFGDLGVGKTTFLRGLAKALGVKSKIKSPTFVGEHIHKISDGQNFLHLDLYRKESLDVESKERLQEIFLDKSLTVAVEWSERLPRRLLPEKRIKIKFRELKNEARKIEVLVR